MIEAQTNLTTMYLQFILIIITHYFGVDSPSHCPPYEYRAEGSAGWWCCQSCEAGKYLNCCHAVWLYSVYYLQINIYRIYSLQFYSREGPQIDNMSNINCLWIYNIFKMLFSTGQYLVKDCIESTVKTENIRRKCLWCPDGTFQAGNNEQKQCSNCTKCDAGTSVI